MKHILLSAIIPKFQVFVLEFAAIVFLIITIPFWLPIAIGVGGIVIVLAVILGLLATCASASEMVMILDYYNLIVPVP